MTRRPDVLLDGLTFPEGPRWRTPSSLPKSDNFQGNPRLWFSDVLEAKVKTVDMDGNVETVASMDHGWTSGLGWLPDGRLAVVSVHDGKLMVLSDQGALNEIADMQSLTGFPCNDMVISDDGTAYIGSAGSGWDETRSPGPGNISSFGFIVAVPHGGKPRIAAQRVTFPNGPAITSDGRTLIFAETLGFRLTAWDINPDGTLSNQRLWADLGVPTDGICLDDEGCAWVAVPYFEWGGPGGYVRVAEGGELKQRIDVDGYGAFACTLGGPDMRTLFMCESSVLGLPRNQGDGRIRIVDVDVPGTGSP